MSSKAATATTSAKSGQSTPVLPPAPSPAPDPGKQWATDTLLKLATFRKPGEVLVRPPADPSFGDLLAAKHALDPSSKHAGELWPSLLRKVPVTFESASSGRADVQLLPDQQPARVLAGRMAGDDAKERLRSVVHDLLNAIDAEIIAGLHRGEGLDQLLPLVDPRSNAVKSITPLWIKENWLMAVPVDALPRGHVCLSWPSEGLYRQGEQSLVVLGRCRAGDWPNQNSLPRSFYPLSHACRLTLSLRARQLRDQLDNAVRPDPAEYQRRHAEFSRLEQLGRQRPAPAPDPRPVTDNRSWSVRLVDAVGWLVDPGRAFRAPPPGTSVASLLEIRKAFSVDDDAAHPNQAAAADLAGLVSGETRRLELLDLLLPLLGTVDRLLAAALERGFIWSAMQAARSTTR